jgi:hypothetical protein
MTKADAWKAFVQHTMTLQPDYRAPDVRGNSMFSCYSIHEDTRGFGPTPEAAIAAAFGEELEPEPPCEDTALLDALETACGMWADGSPYWLLVAEETTSQYATYWPLLLVADPPLGNYKEQGRSLRASLRNLLKEGAE